MEYRQIVDALLVHLTETTAERDQARAEVARLGLEVDKVQARLAEIEAALPTADPPSV